MFGIPGLDPFGLVHALMGIAALVPGLPGAFSSEIVTRIPLLRSGFRVVVTTLFIVIAGASLIHLRLPKAMAALSIHRSTHTTQES